MRTENHSRAISSKLFSAAVRPACFCAFLAALGSMPWVSCCRAESLSSRAAAKVTSGYTPKAASFSLPWNRYFMRQYFEPLGRTSRYSPFSSASLYFFSCSLAAFTCRSVNGMDHPLFNSGWGYQFGGIACGGIECPPDYTPNVPRLCWVRLGTVGNHYGPEGPWFLVSWEVLGLGGKGKWWRWRVSNPRPPILCLKIYMLRHLYSINPSRPESQGVMGELF